MGVIVPGRVTLVAVTDRCQGRGACLPTCPEHATRPHGDPLLVPPGLRAGCGERAEVRPVDATEDAS
ncbi:4Fe-4S ferredoxin [Spirillospora sp. NPDC052269]